MEITNPEMSDGRIDSPKQITEDVLSPYQREAHDWLVPRKTALLALEMGLGKTIISIYAADTINALRILVLCPAVARVNWHREFQKFSRMQREFDILYSSSSRRRDKTSIICSYDLACKFNPCELGYFDVLILDEVHFLKSIDAKRSQKVWGKQGYVRFAKRIWALSGTPAPNNAGELWPILYTFGCVAEKYDDFIKKYCTTIHNGYKLQVTGTKSSAIPELKNVLSQIMLRRLEGDVKLPDIVYDDIAVEAGIVDIDVESSFVQYVFPTDCRNDLEEKLKRERDLVEATIKTAGLGRDGMKILEGLADSVSTLRRYTGLQKVSAVAELVAAELACGAYDKIVIFAIHRDVIEGLRKRLAKWDVVTVYGGTPPEKQQYNIDRFQTNPRCHVFIGNIKAAGTAITLTSANHVIFAEQSWVPGDNAQAAKRCHRRGQTKSVFVRIVALADSFDEKIAAVLKRKAKELTLLFDPNRPFATHQTK